MQNPARFQVFVADPPWLFKDSLPGNGRGASSHYPCMTVEQLCRMPLPELLDPVNCVLFLWRVSSMQQEALDVMRAWGFGAPRSELVWHKRTVHGRRWFGMGRIFRLEHEVCLVGRRGRVPVRDKSVRSILATEQRDEYDLGDIDFEAQAGRHSEKPDESYDIIERLYAGPYCEMFARRQRSGWTCLGNEMQNPHSHLQMG